MSSAVNRLSTASGKRSLGKEVLALASVVVVQWTVLFLFSTSGYFYSDDYMFLIDAANSPLDVHYLTLPVYEHVFPMLRLDSYVVYHLIGFNFLGAQAFGVALCAMATVPLYLCLREVSCNKRVNLCVTALFAFSSFFLAASRWFATAVTAYPATTFSLFALWCFFRFGKTRTRSWLLGATVFYAASLLSAEQSALLMLYVGLAVPLLGGWKGMKFLYRDLLPFVAATIAYLGIYFFGFSTYSSTTWPSWVDGLNSFASGWLRAFFPGLLGYAQAPREWSGMVGTGSIGSWSQMLGWIVLSLSIFIVIFWRACLADGRIKRLWLLFFTVGSVNIAVVVLSRTAKFGVDQLTELRYYVLVTAIFAISLAPSLSAIIRTRRLPTALSYKRGLFAVGAGGVLYLSLFAYFGLSSQDSWAQKRQPADRYFTNLQGDLKKAAKKYGLGSFSVLDTPVPKNVIGAWQKPYNQLLNLAPMIEPGTAVDAVRPVVLTADRHGHLRRTRLVVREDLLAKVSGRPGAKKYCVTAGKSLKSIVTPTGRDPHKLLYLYAKFEGQEGFASPELDVWPGDESGPPDASFTSLDADGSRGDIAPIQGGVAQITGTLQSVRLDIPPHSAGCLRSLQIWVAE